MWPFTVINGYGTGIKCMFFQHLFLPNFFPSIFTKKLFSLMSLSNIALLIPPFSGMSPDTRPGHDVLE